MDTAPDIQSDNMGHRFWLCFALSVMLIGQGQLVLVCLRCGAPWFLTLILTFEVHTLELLQTCSSTYISILEMVFEVTYVYKNVIIKCFVL